MAVVVGRDKALARALDNGTITRTESYGPIRRVSTRRAVFNQIVYDRAVAGSPTRELRQPVFDWTPTCTKKSNDEPMSFYDPKCVASMNLIDTTGLRMVDAFRTMRVREKTLGAICLSKVAQSRRLRIVKTIVEASRSPFGLRIQVPYYQTRHDEQDISAPSDAMVIATNTLQFAMEYLARFLAATEPPTREHTDEAIGLACWLLASKFETCAASPLLKDLVRGTTTEKRELAAAQVDVCIAVKHEFSVVTPHIFLEWFVLAFAIDSNVANCARHFVHTTVHQLKVLPCYPSVVAIAALEASATQKCGRDDGCALSKCLADYAEADTEAIRAVAALFE